MFYLRTIENDGSVVNTQLGESYTKLDLFQMNKNCILAESLECGAITPDDLGNSSISIMVGLKEFYINPNAISYIVSSLGHTYERLYPKEMTPKLWNELFDKWNLNCHFDL